MDDSNERRALLRFFRLFQRGPIVGQTFKLDDSLFASEEKRAPLADRIEKVGHALTARDLARLLNVSAITIFKHAAAGRIPSFRIGTSVRFDPKSVADWIRKKK